MNRNRACAERRARAFVGIGLGLFTLLGGCMSAPQWVSEPTPDDAAEARPVSHHLANDDGEQTLGDESWTVLRVGGNMDARITGSNGDWRFARSRVDTPLPDGYPPPTPPGSIELKKYPAVRRAEYAGRMNPNLGMNFGFWPLFRHIERNDIAMTAPVEMDYHQWQGDNESPRSWTMSFLYRTPELHDIGSDGRIIIADNQPMTVVSVGMTGPYTTETVRRGVATLRDWLGGQSEWSQAGEVRAFFYNDPGVPRDRRWIEVQIPVQHIGGGS